MAPQNWKSCQTDQYIPDNFQAPNGLFFWYVIGTLASFSQKYIILTSPSCWNNHATHISEILKSFNAFFWKYEFLIFWETSTLESSVFYSPLDGYTMRRLCFLELKIFYPLRNFLVCVTLGNYKSFWIDDKKQRKRKYRILKPTVLILPPYWDTHLRY